VTNVDPEEVAALTGAEDSQAESRHVSERDFGKPLRLGDGRLGALRRKLEIGLFQLGNEVSATLGSTYEVALTDVREVHADVVRDGLEEPLSVLRFTAAGQIGWAVWDCPAAVRAVERLLVGTAPADADRALSELEMELVGGVLHLLVESIAKTAEIEIEDPRGTRVLGTMGTWQEVGKGADPHRVAFDVALKRGDEQSELTIYLPGLGRAAEVEEQAPPADVPEHLERIAVELSARLGEIELPLADLLALEDGDVIPLGTPIDGTLSMTVDGHEFARAILGSSRGTLAVRLTEIRPEGSDD